MRRAAIAHGNRPHLDDEMVAILSDGVVSIWHDSPASGPANERA
jgi:hypothetical protein